MSKGYIKCVFGKEEISKCEITGLTVSEISIGVAVIIDAATKTISKAFGDDYEETHRKLMQSIEICEKDLKEDK